MPQLPRNLPAFAFILSSALAVGCGQASPADKSGSDPTPAKGESEFISADPNGPSDIAGGHDADAGLAAGADSKAGAPAADEGARSVERGDIYKVLADRRILNLNSYRGLQVIDV